MNNSTVYTTTTAQMSSNQRKVLNAARTLLIKDGLLLDQPLSGKINQQCNGVNYSISVECGKDIIIINLPLTKGVPNTTRVQVHSELNGELVTIRSVAKSIFRSTVSLTMLYTYVEKLYADHVKEMETTDAKETATRELQELKRELTKTNTALVDKTLRAAIAEATAVLKAI